MRRLLHVATLTVVGLSVGACVSAQPRMQRALDPSMERVLRIETYLSTVSGISANPAKLMRGDGYVYLADVAPQLRYLAHAADTTRFRLLRAVVSDKMVHRDATGVVPMRRYRPGAVFEPATSDGVHALGRALRDGWEMLGDTASAMLVAQMRPADAHGTESVTRLRALTTACDDAMDVVDKSPAVAREVATRARQLLADPGAEAELANAGVSVVEGEGSLLACLTSVGIALQDPDIAVRNLDRLLDLVTPLLTHSGRPGVGTTADMLLALHRVREAGPRYFEPPPVMRGRSSQH